MNTRYKIYLIACLAIIIKGLIIQGKSIEEKKNHENPNVKKAVPQLQQQSLHYRQQGHKCDLICPGQPPLPLPPNFLHNCTTVSNGTTSKPQVSTNVTSSTAKPPKPTGSTTPSEESSEESEEESEVTTKHSNNSLSRKMYRRKHRNSRNQNKIKKHFRREKVLLNRRAKSKLLKHKHLRNRSRLDGCYVVCIDENENPGYPYPNHGGPSEPNEGESPDDSDEDSDNDNYVQGEDTPIEIIYVPHKKSNNIRPVDIYQTNNYISEVWQPQPALPLEYGPIFFEEKQKNNKRKKHRKNNKDMKAKN